MDCCGPMSVGKGQSPGTIPTIKWWNLSCKCCILPNSYIFQPLWLLEEKSQNPKELNVIWKILQNIPKSSKNIPNLSTEDTGTTGLTCLLGLWFLLFGIFAILFFFALQQATQLNMQQPKKPTVKTEETTNGLLWAHVGWKGTIPRKYSHYKMVEPELLVLHTSKLIHFPAPMTFRRKSQNPKELNVIWKILQNIPKTSKNIPNLSTEDTGTTGLTCLLGLWILLFGIFVILFPFSLLQATQLNMQQPKKPTVKTEETTNGLLWDHVGCKGTIPRKYSHYKMVEPELQVLHTSKLIHLPAPMTYRRKSQNPKELNVIWKILQNIPKTSKNIPNLSTEDTGTTGLTCLLALWFLLFGLFAILFPFSLLQATQLNMQQPKKPTVKTEETTNGLLWAHVGWKGTIPRNYSHYKMVEPELQVLHTSKLIHFPAPMTFRRKVTEPKRAQRYLKDPQKHSKIIQKHSKPFNGRHRHRWSDLSPWSLVPSLWHLCHPFSHLCLATSDAAEHAAT